MRRTNPLKCRLDPNNGLKIFNGERCILKIAPVNCSMVLLVYIKERKLELGISKLIQPNVILFLQLNQDASFRGRILSVKKVFTEHSSGQMAAVKFNYRVDHSGWNTQIEY